MSPNDSTVYPIAPNMLAHWHRLERTGALELPVAGAGDAVRVTYTEYKCHRYFVGRHFLGVFTLDGRPLEVGDTYRYHTVGNNRVVRWQGGSSSREGVCACSELVMAALAGRALAFAPDGDGGLVLAVEHRVDQSLHEIEYDEFRCRARLDLAARRLHLARSYFRDSST
jgi:hypothetical protein